MEGNPPDVLVLGLKRSAGNHMKFYFSTYERLVKVEIAYINRIREYKQRLVGVVASALLAALIGFASFLSAAAYARYGEDVERYWDAYDQSVYHPVRDLLFWWLPDW